MVVSDLQASKGAKRGSVKVGRMTVPEQALVESPGAHLGEGKRSSSGQIPWRARGIILDKLLCLSAKHYALDKRMELFYALPQRKHFAVPRVLPLPRLF